MKNKNVKIFILLVVVVLLAGCKNKYGIDTSNYSTKNLEYTKCIRKTVTDNNEKVKINYKLYSDSKGYLRVLISTEEVTSSDDDILDEYEKAYKKIYKPYKNLKYYEHSLLREGNKLTSKAYINYGKVDMKKVYEIEGTENNVKLTNGRIKLKDWKKFAKKYGAMCN